jgi:ArsR family transcriptional regulator
MRDTKVVFDDVKLNYSSELMRAIAHPLRLQILQYIDNHDEINVNHIYNDLDLEQSITSQHLKVLRLAGVVNVRKDGKFMKYNINYSILEKAKLAVDKFLKKNI